MKKQGRSRRINWVVVTGFFVFSAAVYALLTLLTGDALVSAVLAGLIWAALFVPAFLWLTSQMNKRLLAKASPGAGPEHGHGRAGQGSVEGTATAAPNRKAPPAVVGRGEGGGFYHQVRRVPWVDPDVAAAHLVQVSPWRAWGQATGDSVTLRHGSRAWLRIMGAWDWGSRSRNRWPFLASLASDPERGVLEVTVMDNFGRWLSFDSSGSAAFTRVAAHGDVLIAQITDELESLLQRE